MAVHNEEVVLEKKLASLAVQDYPGPMTVHVASDASTDRTESILKAFTLPGSNRDYRYSVNARRLGKPATINQLAEAAGRQGILVLTDASVMLSASTVTELITPLIADTTLGVVDSRIVHTGAEGGPGIGASEEGYIEREVAVKQAEGRYFGYTVGPFGGCWALRAAAFRPVPDTYLVDDFFLCMSAYRAGWRGLSSQRAIVYEGVGQQLRQEFRRKVRIGSGNWQNLLHFRDLWWPPWKDGLAFALFSHKILRWVTPLLVGVIMAALLGLWWGGGNYWAGLLLGMAIGAPLLTLLIDFVLSRLQIDLPVLRNVNYFMAMNLALLVGFLRFLNGIKSNVWQPSYRQQDPTQERDPR
jgi:cellulose synthase/poly-beta-1,6-N-acetylglucosamine synthase-like glycosyltransferase